MFTMESTDSVLDTGGGVIGWTVRLAGIEGRVKEGKGEHGRWPFSSRAVPELHHSPRFHEN